MNSGTRVVRNISSRRQVIALSAVLTLMIIGLARPAQAQDTNDPARIGRWGDVITTPVIPVFSALLPSGKVLSWDSVGPNGPGTYPIHDFTRAMIFDPTTQRSRRVDVAGYNLFCAGFVQLSDGNVLVVGGNKNPAEDGIRQTHVFDWRTESWSRGPDMTAERWYPAIAALGNGEAAFIGGGSSQVEVYRVNGVLDELPGKGYGERAYAFLVPRPDGRLEQVGPREVIGTYDLRGDGTMSGLQVRDTIDRDYGSYATYAPGKTLVTGGGDLTEDGVPQVPTRTSVIVDTAGSGTAVTPAAPMAYPRRQHSLTVLADGSVLATGGERRSVNQFVDLNAGVLAAERWDPKTDSWATLAAAARTRQYHSTALLLPDGRVLTGGGGVCGTCDEVGYKQNDVEFFSPPYLFRSDGSGRPAVRPRLLSVPTSARVGTTVDVKALQSESIAKLALVRLGASTHSIDQGQRYVPLSFSRSLLGLRVRMPANGNVAPPGYYMLFAISADGVPSVASMINIVAPSGSATGPVVTGGGRCLIGTTSGTVTTRACDADDAGQRWVRNADDQTIRASGRCLNGSTGILGLLSSVRLVACRGNESEKWIRYTDQTIRPADNPDYCLQPGGVVDLLGLGVQLRPCSGAAGQRWT